MDDYEGIFVDDEELDHLLIYSALDDESGCLGEVLLFIAMLVL
mgnify:CR=1 FL=1